MGRKRNQPKPIPSFDELRRLRVRCYVRESSERQAMADRNGPEIQRAGLRRFCEQWNIPWPLPEYFDAASGRKTTGRPGLQRALDEARDYDVLLVFHTSRAFRNLIDGALWKPRFADAGITIVFTEQQMISGDPRTKANEGMNAVMDEDHSDTQAMFIMQGLQRKSERGLHNGTAPLGYERHYGPPGDPSNGELVIVPCEAATVRRIFELYATGRYADLEIALAINVEVDADGQPLHRTKKGKPFTDASIRERELEQRPPLRVEALALIHDDGIETQIGPTLERLQQLPGTPRKELRGVGIGVARWHQTGTHRHRPAEVVEGMNL